MMLPIELTKVLYQDWEGQLQASSAEGDLYGKCLNGPGRVKFKNGNQYKGGFKDGMLHGVGKFEWANGIVYEGEFLNNKLEGQGTYRWTDGSSYEGQVKDGLRHGFGKLVLEDCTYEGEWQEGNRHGKGKVTFNNGGIYEGNFMNGLKHGQGKMYYPSGNFYEGEWTEDKKNGQGVMHWIDSREKYSGEWLNNQQHGWGVHLWLDSRGEGKFMRNRYEGEWKNGLRQGFGTFYYANGSKYEGSWRKNMKDGYAFFTDELGRVSQIQFHNDRMVKETKVESSRVEEKVKVEDSKLKTDDKLKKDGKLQNQKRKSTVSQHEQQPSTLMNQRTPDAEPSNPYAVMLHVEELFLPQRLDLQQLYNCLLRNNSQLKNWYRGLSSFYDNHSENTFCLILENVWKMVRSLKLLGRISLAQLDRGFWGTQLNVRQALVLSENHQQKVGLEDIYYFDQSFNTSDSLDFKQRPATKEREEQGDPRAQFNIHDSQRIVLFRDFVQILVCVAINLDANSQSEPQRSVDRFLAKAGPALDLLSRGDKKSTEQSENMSSVSRTEKSTPAYAKTFNQKLWKAISQCVASEGALSTTDTTITLKRFLQYLKVSGIFQDADCGLIEKLLEKHFETQYLNTATGGSEHFTSKLLLLSEYELIEFEFVELLFYYLIKKLPSTKDTEDNRSRYQQFVKRIETAARQVAHNEKNAKKASSSLRLNLSSKHQQKQELIRKREAMEKERARREAIRLQREAEARERRWMQQNDINIVAETFEQEEGEDYD